MSDRAFGPIWLVTIDSCPFRVFGFVAARHFGLGLLVPPFEMTKTVTEQSGRAYSTRDWSSIDFSCIQCGQLQRQRELASQCLTITAQSGKAIELLRTGSDPPFAKLTIHPNGLLGTTVKLRTELSTLLSTTAPRSPSWISVDAAIGRSGKTWPNTTG